MLYQTNSAILSALPAGHIYLHIYMFYISIVAFVRLQVVLVELLHRVLVLLLLLLLA